MKPRTCAKMRKALRAIVRRVERADTRTRTGNDVWSIARAALDAKAPR